MLGGFATNNKLQGKDLINIGIFTAIYFIVIFAAASIGFIPIFIPLISVIVPLVGGIPMMLFFSKIKKFGMLTICGVLLGIIMLLTGMGWWCIPTGLIFGLISRGNPRCRCQEGLPLLRHSDEPTSLPYSGRR